MSGPVTVELPVATAGCWAGPRPQRPERTHPHVPENRAPAAGCEGRALGHATERYRSGWAEGRGGSSRADSAQFDKPIAHLNQRNDLIDQRLEPRQ